jgi:hypothetical protein
VTTAGQCAGPLRRREEGAVLRKLCAGRAAACALHTPGSCSATRRHWRAPVSGVLVTRPPGHRTSRQVSLWVVSSQFPLCAPFSA